MGLFRSGIYDKATLFLKEISGISHFVETGTYYGNTTKWAASHFEEVDTVEYCEEIFIEAKKILQPFNNVRCTFGDSRMFLKNIVSHYDNRMIFWLDAHWSSANTYGENDQCPLLDELSTIFNDSREHIIMIDDARTFLSPPMPPNDPLQFPTIKDLMDAIPHNRFHVIISEDVVYVLPHSIWNKKTELFFQNEAKRIDEQYFAKSRFYDKYSEIDTIGLRRFVIGKIKNKILGTK